MKLPTKSQIENWEHLPTIYRLMSENRWTLEYSRQWFKDFMKWLYTAMRSDVENQTRFIMDGIHYLDDVWHAYILHTADYMRMSHELFAVEIIHHAPENPFLQEPLADEVILHQMGMLIEDWGDEYVDRVWRYGADIYDIIAEISPDSCQ